MKKYFLLFRELCFLFLSGSNANSSIVEIKVHQICSQYNASLVYIIKLL